MNDALLQILDQYQAAHPEEAAMVERVRVLASAHDDCFERTCLPGHITGSAWVLSPDRTQCLLLHHRKLDKWLQPGGHVEGDDRDLIASARREVLEEVGLHDLDLVHDGILDLDVHSIPARTREPRHEHFDVRFLFAAPTRTLVANDEVADARWVQLDEIGDVHGDESVLRAARKIRSLCAPS